MMNTQTMTEAMQSWQEAQQTMMQTWMKSFQLPSSNELLENLTKERENMLNTWQQAINKGFETQTQWLDTWTEAFSTDKGTPEVLSEWASHSSNIIKSVGEGQQKLSDLWFEMAQGVEVGKFDAETLNTNIKKALDINAWQAQNQKVMETWQETTQNVLQAQLEMAKAMTGAMTEAAQEAAEKVQEVTQQVQEATQY